MDRRCRASEIVDLIYLEQDRLGDIVPDQLKAMIVQQVRDILLAASEEIIETNNVVALREQSFTKMRANKPGTAGNKNSHITLMAKKSGTNSLIIADEQRRGNA
jgi:hypothetical protein